MLVVPMLNFDKYIHAQRQLHKNYKETQKVEHVNSVVFHQFERGKFIEIDFDDPETRIIYCSCNF